MWEVILHIITCILQGCVNPEVTETRFSQAWTAEWENDTPTD